MDTAFIGEFSVLLGLSSTLSFRTESSNKADNTPITAIFIQSCAKPTCLNKNFQVNGTGWHQAGGDKASATALLVNSIRNSPTQQLVGTSLANQLSAINHQSLSSSPVLQQLTTQQQQQVQVAQQQQQQYGSGIR